MIKHSLANYPKKFLGCVVSPTKICMQFAEVTSKLRFKEGADYIKSPYTIKALPIKVTGTDIDILAVGAQLPEIEELQLSLTKAYLEYSKVHSQRYKQEYNKEFIDFILKIHTEIGEVIKELTSQ